MFVIEEEIIFLLLIQNTSGTFSTANFPINEIMNIV